MKLGGTPTEKVFRIVHGSYAHSFQDFWSTWDRMAKQDNQTISEVRMKFLFGLFISVAVTLIPITYEALAAKGDLEKGKTLYMKHCAVCHGPSGKGDGYLFFDPPVADLTSPAIQKKSDFDLWRKIHEGVSNTAMGDWKWTLSDAEAAHVLTYVRSFSH